MPVMIALVALVGVLCVLDLILTVGVIRRLREHTDILSRRARPNDYYKASIRIGEEVGEFTASTVDGEPVSRELLDAETVVAFFSPACKPCKAKLPLFVDYARALPGGRDRVLAAVAGETEEAAELVAALEPVARVVVDNDALVVGKAFQVQTYPAVLTVAPNGTGLPVVTDDDVQFDRPAVAVRARA